MELPFFIFTILRDFEKRRYTKWKKMVHNGEVQTLGPPKDQQVGFKGLKKSTRNAATSFYKWIKNSEKNCSRSSNQPAITKEKKGDRSFFLLLKVLKLLFSYVLIEY